MKTLLIATQALILGTTAAFAQTTTEIPETPAPVAAQEKSVDSCGGKGAHKDGRGERRGEGRGERRGNGHGHRMNGMNGMNGMMPGYVMVPMMVPGYGVQMVPMMPMMPQMMMPYGGQGYDGHLGKGYGHDRGEMHGKRDRGDDRGDRSDRGDRGERRGGMRAPFFADLMEDGQITQDEFDAKAAQIFERLDANGDGVIQADELPGRRGGKGPKADATPEAETEVPSSDN